MPEHRLQIDLNADGSVDVLDYEALVDWCERHGRQIQIIVTHVGEGSGDKLPCDCGADKANTTHADWCGSRK